MHTPVHWVTHRVLDGVMNDVQLPPPLRSHPPIWHPTKPKQHSEGRAAPALSPHGNCFFNKLKTIGILWQFSECQRSAFPMVPDVCMHTHTHSEVAEGVQCMAWAGGATASMKAKAASEQGLCQLLKSTILGTKPTFKRKWDTSLCHKISTKNYPPNTKLASRKFERKIFCYHCTWVIQC